MHDLLITMQLLEADSESEHNFPESFFVFFGGSKGRGKEKERILSRLLGLLGDEMKQYIKLLAP